MRPARRFFVKVDPDTVVLPHKISRSPASWIEGFVTPFTIFFLTFDHGRLRVPVVQPVPLLPAAFERTVGAARSPLSAVRPRWLLGLPNPAEAFLERVDRFTYGERT